MSNLLSDSSKSRILAQSTWTDVIHWLRHTHSGFGVLCAMQPLHLYPNHLIIMEVAWFFVHYVIYQPVQGIWSTVDFRQCSKRNLEGDLEAWTLTFLSACEMSDLEICLYLTTRRHCCLWTKYRFSMTILCLTTPPRKRKLLLHSYPIFQHFSHWVLLATVKSR